MALNLPHRQKQRFAATVKDSTHQSRTPVKYAKSRSGEISLMFCGVHPRLIGVPILPAVGSADGHGRYNRSYAHSKVFYKRALGSGDRRGSCICDYYSYPELLESLEGSDENTPFQFPLLDLPRDVFIMVLEIAFKLDRAIEFCPVSVGPKRIWGEPEDNARHDRVPKLHEDHVHKQLSPYVGLLRACKKVHFEAAKVLYGSNEYRFTHNGGWPARERFLCKINEPMCANLRNVTVCHPDLFISPRTPRREADCWATILLIDRKECPEEYKTDSGGSNWSRQVSRSAHDILERLGSSENLRLILPRFAPGGYRKTSSPLDATRFSDLAVTFTSLGVPSEELAMGRCRDFEELAAEYEYIEADENGLYAAIDGTRSYKHTPWQDTVDAGMVALQKEQE